MLSDGSALASAVTRSMCPSRRVCVSRFAISNLKSHRESLVTRGVVH